MHEEEDLLEKGIRMIVLIPLIIFAAICILLGRDEDPLE